MSSQRRLGRGLEALLGRSLDEQGHPPVPQATDPMGEPIGEAENFVDPGVMSRDEEGQRWLDIGVIEANPFQPRKHFDEEQIADLADSIREHGVLQPLLVRRLDGRFQLVAGERRLRAAQAAGWQRVPVQVRACDDRETAELAIVENLQRTDLNAIEKATSFDRYLREYDCTQEELGRRIHINRATIANLVRLLELPQEVKQMVIDGALTAGHAKSILGLPADQQTTFAKRVSSEGLTVRKTEELVQEAAQGGLRVVGDDGVSRQPGATRSEQIAALEQELTTALGTKVALSQNAKGAGKITLHFKDADEFERLRAILRGEGQPVTNAA
ncbi:ParB/RepB/Spo0J family partition protein [Botrimarina mediterranea]|uniref:Putative chromosome-partitioning protein ParB n=1 Tax=Botrimarina mediterranea TaxID=2528022 RepID=A0A518K441_9BACT|nr:ParB/RepB/Spo0J family partition protein [Botrimarina mediterranea]QDV72563.1 putative chromosome-partitioning protein ParB [Botrimarina mediterranea]QDV77135.1 putative chromosome-partitioning protein ParB [Planctomycetes bacterium K2D]